MASKVSWTKNPFTGEFEATNDKYLSSLTTAMSEPTGFEDRTGSDFTFTDGTRTLEVTVVGTSYDIWLAGNKHIISTAKDIIITDVEGIHLIYFDTDDILHEAVNPTDTEIATVIRDKVLVAYLYWDATNNESVYVGEERHGCIMDGHTHIYLHFTRGMQIQSGLGLGSFTIGAGNLDTHAQFGSEAGVADDEDLFVNIDAVISTTGYPVLWRTGAAGDWRTDTQANFSVLNAPASRVYYNQFTAGAWQQTEVTNNKFCLYHIFATTGKTNQIYSIMGQAEYATLNAARTGANTEVSDLLLGDLPSAEIRPVGTIIYQTNNGYVNAVKAKIVQTVEGDDYVDWRSTELPRGTAPSNHSSLTGLANDDHLQYALLAGRSGGQSLYGGTDAGDDLDISSTSDVTKGTITFDGSDFLINNAADRSTLANHPSGAVAKAIATTYYVDYRNHWTGVGGKIYPNGQAPLIGGPVNTHSLVLNGNAVNDVGLEISAAGLLTVDAVNYETLVVADDDIPNKKYVDDLVAGVDTFLELTDTPAAYNAGRILFEGAATVDDDADLHWDNTNKRFGVGLVAPNNLVDVDGTVEAISLLVTGSSAFNNPAGSFMRFYWYAAADCGRMYAYDPVGANYEKICFGDWNGGSPPLTLAVGGKVGIGVPHASVTEALTVAGDGVFTGDIGAGIKNPLSRIHLVGAGTNAKLTLESADIYSTPPKSYIDSKLKYNAAGNATAMGRIEFGKHNATSGNTAGYMAFYNKNTGVATSEAMRIDPAGNLGIGTTTPDTNLEIVDAGTDTQTGLYVTGYNDQQTYGPHIMFRKSHSDTKGTMAQTPTATELGGWYWYGVNSNSTWGQGFHIIAVQSGAAGVANVPTIVRFETLSATGQNDDQLVLTPNGRVGINYAVPSAQLDVVQSVTDNNLPVMRLVQSDVDKPFIEFRGEAAAADITRSIVDVGDVSSATVAGYVKIEIDDTGNQVTDAEYFMPFYTLT